MKLKQRQTKPREKSIKKANYCVKSVSCLQNFVSIKQLFLLIVKVSEGRLGNKLGYALSSSSSGDFTCLILYDGRSANAETPYFLCHRSKRFLSM